MPQETEDIKTTLLEILKQSIQDVYYKDIELVSDAKEQDLAHRLAQYFENRLNLRQDKEPLSVDTDYNKHKDNMQTVYCNCTGCIVPETECIHKIEILNLLDKYINSQSSGDMGADIVIHKRDLSDNDHLVIEVKLNKPKDKETFLKLTYFTCKYGKYKYNLGCYVNIEKNLCSVITFEEGIPKESYKYRPLDETWESTQLGHC